MEKFELDKRDRRLLALLYQNSRSSYAELGKKLRLSGSTVERRVSALKDAHVISSLFANANLAKLGFMQYRIYLKFGKFDESAEAEVLGLFQSYRRTNWGAICEGEYDAIWSIVAQDESEVEDAINLALERFGGNIIGKTVATTTYGTYMSWNRLLGGEGQPEPRSKKRFEREEADKTDMGILALLYGDARKPTIEIAKAVRLSPDAVAYRVRNLTKRGLILGYISWYNPKSVGLEYYKIFIDFRNTTKDKERLFISFCSQSDNVVFLNKCIGSWDMEIDVIADGIVEFHRFMSQLKARFGDMIGNHSYVTVIDDLLLNPLREYLE